MVQTKHREEKQSIFFWCMSPTTFPQTVNISNEMSKKDFPSKQFGSISGNTRVSLQQQGRPLQHLLTVPSRETHYGLRLFPSTHPQKIVQGKVKWFISLMFMFKTTISITQDNNFDVFVMKEVLLLRMRKLLWNIILFSFSNNTFTLFLIINENFSC